MGRIGEVEGPGPLGGLFGSGRAQGGRGGERSARGWGPPRRGAPRPPPAPRLGGGGAAGGGGRGGRGAGGGGGGPEPNCQGTRRAHPTCEYARAQRGYVLSTSALARSTHLPASPV